MSDSDSPSPRKKRFTYKSYQESLKSIHLPAASSTSAFDHEINDTESHFHNSIEHWRQLNLAPSFLSYANRVQRISGSMALLLLNWKEIVCLWVETVANCEEDALRPLLEMMLNLAHDIRTILLPQYPTILSTILALPRRSLPTEALTALLSTLSSLFRYVVIPSPQTLRPTWLALQKAMVEANTKLGGTAGGEMQRMFAEVWGAVVRRLKSAPREEIVRLLVDGLEQCEDGVAWVFISAIKAPSESLHPCTSLILPPLMECYLNSDDLRMFGLVRRVLTALMHHVTNSSGFLVVSDLLLGMYKKEAEEPGANGAARLARMWRVLAVLTGVRKGKRVTQKHIASILSITALPNLNFTAAANTALVDLVLSTLAVSEAGTRMGPGRTVVGQIWEHDRLLGLQLASVLADINWSGWRLTVLPHVLKQIPCLLEDGSQIPLVLFSLAKFHLQGRLDDGGANLRRKVGVWTAQRLDQFSWSSTNGEQASELRSIATLSSFVPQSTIAPSLVKIIQSILLSTPDRKVAEEAYMTKPSNSSFVLASAMRALAATSEGILSEEYLEDVDIHFWVNKSIEVFGWDHAVLEQMVLVLHSCSKATSSIKLPCDVTFSILEPSLMSPEQNLRLATLRLLLAPFVLRSPAQEEALKKCLAAEELKLDSVGYRERVVKIGRIGVNIKEQELPIIISWLTAQLKVNIRPLWAAAAQALAAVSQKFPEHSWNILFRELKLAADGSLAALGGATPKWPSTTADDSGEEQEEERTWRCPNRINLQLVLDRWTSGSDLVLLADLTAEQLPQSRLDVVNYEAQLLHALGETPGLAEKNNRDLVALFLSHNADPPLPRNRLSSYLTLFSKFANPKSLYQSNSLHRLYLELLALPDRPLQTLALTCLTRFKSPNLVPYENFLQLLLDETKWRDNVSNFNFEEVVEGHREELSSVVTRLSYGLIGERKGRSRGADRKAATLGLLASFRDVDLKVLVELMLRPFGGLESFTSTATGTEYVLHGIPNASKKQLMGYLSLVGDVLRNLGSKLVSYWPALLGTTIEILARVQQLIEENMEVEGQAAGDATETLADMEEVQEDADEMDDEELGPTPGRSSTKFHRHVRQLGLRRFTDFFRVSVSFDFKPYLSASFNTFLSPRLAALDKENVQSPSALLELFVTWSNDPQTIAFLEDYDNRVVPRIFDCLRAPTVQSAVISKIIEIIERLHSYSKDCDLAAKRILQNHTDHLLSCLATLAERSSDRNYSTDHLVQRLIGILSAFAPLITDGRQASSLLGLLSPQLRKSFRLVPDRTKSDMLVIVQNLIPLAPELKDEQEQSFTKLYELLSLLFQALKGRQARVNLVGAFHQLSLLHPSNLALISQLLGSLNCFSTVRSEEPDFDRRLHAFGEINETHYSSLTPQQWLPLLYNMLHCIEQSDELSLRSNAGYSLRRLVDVVSGSNDDGFNRLFMRILYPGIRSGMRSKVEAVRSEHLAVLAHAVDKCITVASLQEMRPLLVGGDEEASFFNNVLHIQVHRRIRALHRLRELCAENRIQSSTLADIFLPLLGHFVLSAGKLDHALVNDSITTIGLISRQLSWSPYNLALQHYLKLAKEKGTSEKVCIRTLVAILDNFHFAMEEIVEEVPGGEDPTEADADPKEDMGPVLPVPQTTKIVESVNSRILPNLMQYLEKRDDTDDAIRIPVAIGIVKVALHLPSAQREAQISRLLTVLSQILRSKTQDTRDLAKDTLCKIAITLGPKHFAVVIKEMRHALTRGPQLHVLASVTHAVLTQVTSAEHAAKFERLDDAVADVAHVSAEVIFGQSGKDAMNEEYRTKMKEVRGSSSRALDSLMLMAKHVSSSKIVTLLEPCRAVMHETEALKVMTLVDDVLRRITSGLNSNSLVTPLELLVLIHTLVSQNAKFLNQATSTTKGGKKRVHQDVTVDLRVKQSHQSDHFTTNSFRFVVFGLDLFITAYKRSRFDFSDPNVVARLQPLVPVIGNTLYSTNAQVLALSLRAVAGIVKCPLANLPKSLPVYVRQTLVIIQQSGNTESEVVQTAMKTLAVLIRDRADSEVKESDLSYLLALVSPDLEEPGRQSAVFALLRAIVSRRFVVPEMYDLMDRVSEVMVTNQSSQVQELCRSLLLQFLLDYPQGKGRLRNQMQFLAKNLSFVFEAGRRSVMELLSAIFAKFDPELLQQYSDLFFVALIMVLANDDSAKCREKAAELVKLLLKRLDGDQRKTTMSHIHSWAIQDSQPQLARVAAQVYGLAIDVLQQEVKPYAATIMDDLDGQIHRSRALLAASELEVDADGGEKLEWQVPYQALTSLTKLLQLMPGVISDTEKVRWESIVGLMLFPHTWVRLACTRLQGMLFTANPIASPNPNLPSDHPLSLHGLLDAARKLSLQLKSDNLDSPLALQVVKNLFYIGKCFALTPTQPKDTGGLPSASAADEEQETHESENGEGEAADANATQNPLAWMFTKLSHQARAAYTSRRNKYKGPDNWSQQPSSIFQWFAAMASHLDEAVLSQYLVHILSPVYRFTDDDTIKEPAMDDLKSLAIELQDMVQAKVGTTKFSTVYNDVRQAVLSVRRERKNARAVQATTDPRAAAKRRLQRNISKMASRKRKSSAFSHGRETKRMRNY